MCMSNQQLQLTTSLIFNSGIPHASLLIFCYSLLQYVPDIMDFSFFHYYCYYVRLSISIFARCNGYKCVAAWLVQMACAHADHDVYHHVC
jgi:hypothetical protein